MRGPGDRSPGGVQGRSPAPFAVRMSTWPAKRSRRHAPIRGPRTRPWSECRVWGPGDWSPGGVRGRALRRSSYKCAMGSQTNPKPTGFASDPVWGVTCHAAHGGEWPVIGVRSLARQSAARSRRHARTGGRVLAPGRSAAYGVQGTGPLAGCGAEPRAVRRLSFAVRREPVALPPKPLLQPLDRPCSTAQVHERRGSGDVRCHHHVFQLP